MDLEQYKQNIMTMNFDDYITNIKYCLNEILKVIQETMRVRDFPRFLFFFDYPPDDIINKYISPSSFTNDWVLDERPIIGIVTLNSCVGFTDRESLVSYDVEVSFRIDFLYPHYNIDEFNNSLDKFTQFIGLFTDMFEQSGRSWKLNGERIFVDRDAISVTDFDYTVYAETLCHIATCDITFTLWKPSVTEELNIT